MGKGNLQVTSLKVLFKADWIWAPSAAAVGASAVGILIASRSTIVFFVATQGKSPMELRALSDLIVFTLQEF